MNFEQRREHMKELSKREKRERSRGMSSRCWAAVRAHEVGSYKPEVDMGMYVSPVTCSCIATDMEEWKN